LVLRSIGIVLVVILFFTAACSPKKLAGTYVLCAWNCQTLVLDDEQSFVEIIRPEIGDTQKIKGYYEYNGRLLTLYQDQVDLYIDGIKISSGTTPFFQYKTKWNRLVEQTNTNQSYKKCDYTKLSEKPKKDIRIAKRNKLRCTTRNPVMRFYYWIRN
jgi:hypothetical protein